MQSVAIICPEIQAHPSRYANVAGWLRYSNISHPGDVVKLTPIERGGTNTEGSRDRKRQSNSTETWLALNVHTYSTVGYSVQYIAHTVRKKPVQKSVRIQTFPSTPKQHNAMHDGIYRLQHFLAIYILKQMHCKMNENKYLISLHYNREITICFCPNFPNL